MAKNRKANVKSEAAKAKSKPKPKAKATVKAKPTVKATVKATVKPTVKPTVKAEAKVKVAAVDPPRPPRPPADKAPEHRSKPARKRTKVAFVGLGLMGAPMAFPILRAGFPLQVWNRTADKAKDLVTEGATLAPTPAAAARGADVVIVMVADDAALDMVLFGEEGLSRGLKRGAVVVNCSTTSPGMGFRAGTALRSLSVRFLEAPIMRSVYAAREGQLQMLVGGTADDFARARSVLEVLASDIHYVGDVGRAATLKLACNILVAALTQAFAEYFVVARKSGVPFETMMSVLHAGPLDSQVLRDAEQTVVNPGARPNFYLRHMLKDLNLALELAQQLDVPTPLAAATRQILAAANNLGHGNRDFGAIVELMAQWAAVPIRG